MLPIRSRCRLACVVLLFSTATAEPSTPRDRELLEGITTRLLDVAEPIPALDPPPLLRIAGTGLRVATLIRREGLRRRAVITINTDLMDHVVNGDADVLAFIVAHQLARIAHGQLLPETAENGPAEKPKPIGAKEEAQAEWSAAELLVRAGFSLRRALRGIARLQEIDKDAHSFDGLAVELPSWEKRLEVFDREQLPLAKQMSAWTAGAIFLATDQFQLAELCLERVTQEFPATSDAWIGLGYARLMLYLDRLTAEELREYGLNMVVSPGFLRRGAFEPLIRGKRPRVWLDAVEALHEGLRQNPKHVRAQATVGLAYLFHPRGRQLDRALEFLQPAADAAVKDRLVSRRERATILANLATARAANGQADKSHQSLAALEKLYPQNEPMPRDLISALAYRRADLLTVKKDRASRVQAVEQLAVFLRQANPLSTWWEMALAQYRRLCEAEGKEPVERAEWLRLEKQRLHPRSTIRFDPEPGFAWRDPTAEAVRKLGPARSVAVTRGTNVVRLTWKRGCLELLAAQAIFAVRLAAANSPAIVFDQHGKPRRLQIGMKVMDGNRVFAVDYQEWTFFDGELSFRFDPNLGLAIRGDNDRLSEIIVVSPSEPRGE